MQRPSLGNECKTGEWGGMETRWSPYDTLTGPPSPHWLRGGGADRSPRSSCILETPRSCIGNRHDVYMVHERSRKNTVTLTLVLQLRLLGFGGHTVKTRRRSSCCERREWTLRGTVSANTKTTTINRTGSSSSTGSSNRGAPSRSAYKYYYAHATLLPSPAIDRTNGGGAAVGLGPNDESGRRRFLFHGRSRDTTPRARPFVNLRGNGGGKSCSASRPMGRRPWPGRGLQSAAMVVRDFSAFSTPSPWSHNGVPPKRYAPAVRASSTAPVPGSVGVRDRLYYRPPGSRFVRWCAFRDDCACVCRYWRQKNRDDSYSDDDNCRRTELSYRWVASATTAATAAGLLVP